MSKWARMSLSAPAKPLLDRRMPDDTSTRTQSHRSQGEGVAPRPYQPQPRRTASVLSALAVVMVVLTACVPAPRPDLTEADLIGGWVYEAESGHRSVLPPNGTSRHHRPGATYPFSRPLRPCGIV